MILKSIIVLLVHILILSYSITDLASISTVMFSKKKARFFKGPKLPKDINQIDYLSYPPCVTAYNRTHYFLLEFRNSVFGENPSKISLIEFKTQNKILYPSLEYDRLYFASACDILMSKEESRLVTHFQTRHANDMIFESYIMSYNLNIGIDGQWETHQRLEIDSKISKKSTHTKPFENVL